MLTLLNVNDSKLLSAIILDAEQHPGSEFNFGNTTPPEPPKTKAQIQEELKVRRAKEREELLKMIEEEKKRMEQEKKLLVERTSDDE